MSQTSGYVVDRPAVCCNVGKRHMGLFDFVSMSEIRACRRPGGSSYVMQLPCTASHQPLQQSCTPDPRHATEHPDGSLMCRRTTTRLPRLRGKIWSTVVRSDDRLTSLYGDKLGEEEKGAHDERRSWRVGGVGTSSSLGCSIPGPGYDRPGGVTPGQGRRASAAGRLPLRSFIRQWASEARPMWFV